MLHRAIKHAYHQRMIIHMMVREPISDCISSEGTHHSFSQRRSCENAILLKYSL